MPELKAFALRQYFIADIVALSNCSSWKKLEVQTLRKLEF